MADGDGDWPQRLDVQELLQGGWRPTPLRSFVIKIHSRCNLACDYCYMYEMADQGWRSQPRRMSRRTIDIVAARIAEHAHGNGLRRVEVVLHGGEPLLAGPAHLRYAVEAVRRAAGPGVEVAFQVQTNGTLLDSLFLELFDELDVGIGVSLDGDEDAHDRHRTRKDGRGSYWEILSNLDLLTSARHRRLFSGLLCTIDLRNDPVATYESLLAFGPPGIDFLLPHGTWDAPPPGRLPDGSSPYGDWLVAVFDRWYGAPERETRIRLFNEIIQLLFGRPSRSESIGLSPVALAVVETDGRIEQVDSLKSAFDGAARTPLHVARNTFDEALLLPSFAARQIGVRALSDTCRACELHRVCGGGLYPHRYRSVSGFRNPSVFCSDLFRLIGHIRDTIASDVEDLRRGRR